MDKPTKDHRWNLRVPTELNERAKQTAHEVGKSLTQLIEDAVWSYVTSEKIAKCPTCYAACFHIEDIPISEGVGDVVCVNNHTHQYDFDKERFV